MAVVLPAPSGPTSPTISPACTCRLRPSTARKEPKFLTKFCVSSKTSVDMLLYKHHIGRHTELQFAFGIIDGQFYGIHRGTASLDSLNIARCEFGLVGNFGDDRRKGFTREGINRDCRFLSDVDFTVPVLGDVDRDGQVSKVGHGNGGSTGLDKLTWLHIAGQDHAIHRGID